MLVVGSKALKSRLSVDQGLVLIDGPGVVEVAVANAARGADCEAALVDFRSRDVSCASNCSDSCAAIGPRDRKSVV